MNTLVKDLKTHPLIPGAILASVAGDPQLRRLRPFDSQALDKLNKRTTVEILTELQEAGLITADQADKVLNIDARHIRAFRDLTLHIPEVADAAGCDVASVQQLARALFSSRLLADYLEILTPPDLSYDKTANGTVDLLAALLDSVRHLVGGAWSVFFPREEFGLVAARHLEFA